MDVLGFEERGEGWDEGGNLAKMQLLKTCFDADLSQKCPLTSILSSLLRTEYVHVLSPRAPEGRGGKCKEPQLD
jgi:hypothetical protein